MPAVWTIEANGAEEVVETYGYLTDLLPSYDEHEQRRKLRAVPVESLEFGILCTDARQSGLAESLLWGLQDEALVVPLWQYGRRLIIARAAGGNIFNVDPSVHDDAYRIGGYMVAWRDPFTYELFTVDELPFPSQIKTNENAVSTWPIGTLVFPARLARVTSRVNVDRLTTGVLAGRAVFTAETAEATVLAAESLPLYRSLPVLTVVPDRVGSADAFERKVFLLDSKTGTRSAEAPSVGPQVTRAFSWLAFTRAEAKARREFIDARRGRAGPFWVSSWESDFALASDHAPGASVLTVLARDYAARVFPAGQGRRHLGVRTPDGTAYYRHVEAAVDNLDGTESLTLDAAVPVALAADSALVSSLRYCRLDADEARVEWTGGQFSSCSLPMRELPAEAPA